MSNQDARAPVPTSDDIKPVSQVRVLSPIPEATTSTSQEVPRETQNQQEFASCRRLIWEMKSNVYKRRLSELRANIHRIKAKIGVATAMFRIRDEQFKNANLTVADKQLIARETSKLAAQVDATLAELARELDVLKNWPHAPLVPPLELPMPSLPVRFVPKTE